MGKITMFLGCAALGCAAFGEADVTRVLVRQQWPWNDTVRIDYEVAGVEQGGVDLDLQVTLNGQDVAADRVRAAVTGGALYAVRNGLGSVELDPKLLAAGLDAEKFTLAARLSVTGASDPRMDRIEYLVLDLETGTKEVIRRRDFYNNPKKYGAFTTDYSTIGPGFASALGEGETFIWTGVNTGEYKTRKMAFKRISAKDVVWTMGPAENDPNARAPGFWSHPDLGESRVEVQLSKDYYIGVFELTQTQYWKLTGENPSFFTNVTLSAQYPVEQVPLSHQDMVAKLATFRDFGFRIPTEAQWEFACRAGYEGTGLPNGKPCERVMVGSTETFPNLGELEGVAYAVGNMDRNAGTVVQTVGTGRPNAFGLYNMLGNVSEWVAEEPRTNPGAYYASAAKPVVDPQVTSPDAMFGSNYGVLKGGNFQRIKWRYAARLATPDGQALVWNQPVWGWRLALEAE